MRLTKTDREAFVSAVLDDVPFVDYQEQARVAVQKWAIDHLPPKLKELHKEFCHFFKTDSIWGLPGTLRSVYVVTADSAVTLGAMKADKKFWAMVVKLSEDKKAQTLAREQLQAKIEAAIVACSTVEQAHERMPEFASYLKATAPAKDRSVPVVANLVADLTAAGWPKDKKRATARKAA